MAQPTSVYQLKPAFQRSLRPLTRWLWHKGVTPNGLTVAGVITAACAGLAVALSAGNGRVLAAVPFLYLVRMAFNAMDGMMAREFAAPTVRGRWLNEAGDVAGDAAAYLPFIVLMPNAGAAALLIAVVMAGVLAEVTSLVGSEAGARPNHGPFGKSDRAIGFGILAVFVAPLSRVVWVPLGVMGVLALLTIRNRVAALEQGER